MKDSKSIKFIVLSVLVIAMVVPFVSCSGEEAIDIDLIDLSNYIESKLDFGDFINIAESESGIEKMRNEFTIKEENTAQSVLMVSLNINSSEMLLFAEVVDKGSVKEIENILKQRKSDILRGLKDYDANPDNEAQYYIVDASKIIIKGNYIFWVVHSEQTEINNMIDEFIKENS